MERTFFALLVGIDEYPPGADMSNLKGCVNDINHFKGYLEENITFHRHIQTLTNSDATRANIILMFRRHLCQAKENDVVLFHYSGHGSREISAPQFREFSAEGMDETLVCHDSRLSGGFDLADKELAVLLHEVAKKNPHLAVSMDCCHSGTITRDIKIGTITKEIPERVRETRERFNASPRPLRTYLDGYYTKMSRIHIPQSKHILMAACNRSQQAWETLDHSGVYTYSLMETLKDSGPIISYGDLFTRCQTKIVKQGNKQTPQLEPYLDFNPHCKFLDGQEMKQISDQQKITTWTKNLNLQNQDTKLDMDQVGFWFIETTPGAAGKKYEGESITLTYRNTLSGWQKISGKIQVQNHMNGTIYVSLFYLSAQFGIHLIRSETLTTMSNPVTLWGDGEQDCIKLPDSMKEAKEIFKLIVSTEERDDFMIIQEGLGSKNNRSVNRVEQFKRMRQLRKSSDWFTKTMTIRAVRQ
jgi:Caspase domain